jgi:general stress protein CsbA
MRNIPAPVWIAIAIIAALIAIAIYGYTSGLWITDA